MSYLYLITVFLLIVIFLVVFLLMERFKNQLLTNILFCSIVFICYVIHVLVVYSKVGANDWNFQNTLPYANVSPFMFFVSPLFFALPKGIRKYFGSLISLLVVGMLLSPIMACIRCFVISYQFHASFLLDYASHLALALWGVYLVQSGQLEWKKKDCLIGGSFIVGVAIIMMILNIIFDTSFFGLSLNGKHSIYNVVLVENSYLSALIYFAGLGLVLLAGFFFEKFLCFVLRKRKKD